MTSKRGVAGQSDEAGNDGWLDELVCPECEASLGRIAAGLSCDRCGRIIPISNGVPQFVENFPYWGEIPQQQMIDVNRRAATGAWKTALLDSGDPAVQKASGMILNLDRANWKYLVNLPRNSRVLDVGAGTGTNSHSLALHYQEVVALEPVRERIEFMQQRFLQERLSNVRIVRSSLWSLPFAPNSFDLAAMNGVLEWVPEGRAGDPKQVQIAALKRMHRLLRPGGYLYVGIENRMVPGYFIGYPDPHSGMPFVTVLPRPLAHWYARRRGQAGGYRNYLYSSRGYRKLLEQSGFRDVEVYMALPSYNHPRFLVPMNGGATGYYFQNFSKPRGSWLRRLAHNLLLKTGVQKYLEYSFVILARKP